MKERNSPDPPMEVPAWFFTYTDVITLLMTFFVLMLTFATSEPERFERMQVALFGGSGGTGVAGPAEVLEKDTVLLRERPRSARLTTRGSEMPPIHSDVTTQSLASGLQGLEEEPTAKTVDSFTFDMPVSLLVTDDEAITSVGAQYLRMFARQLRKGTHDITFSVSRESEIPHCMALCDYLIQHEQIKPASIAAGVSPGSRSSTMRIVLNYNPPR